MAAEGQQRPIRLSRLRSIAMTLANDDHIEQVNDFPALSDKALKGATSSRRTATGQG